MNTGLKLDSVRIIETIERLERRVADRFPQSGLQNVCSQFANAAKSSKPNIEWIAKPNLFIRFSAFLIIALGIFGLVYSLSFIAIDLSNTTLTNLAMVMEAIFNDIILLGAGIYFLVSLETRLKRRKALKSLNELRVIAHVIDMHQLTKDPTMVHIGQTTTVNSPKRSLSKFELQRYLDYCTEATALIAKVSALYAQSLPDEVVVNATNDIEALCTGLSQKIWQKIVILNQ